MFHEHLPPTIEVIQIEPNCPLPAYATYHSAGADLRAMRVYRRPDYIVASGGWTEEVIRPGATVMFGTGLKISITDNNYAVLILPRSGLGHNYGIVLGNLVGLIDSDYQGELLISCWNRSHTEYVVSKGDRIAQLVVIPVIDPIFKQVTEFTPSARGEGGFGSTGYM